MKTIVSVGDYTGAWSQPWRDDGYRTVRIDPKLPTDLYPADRQDVTVGDTVAEAVLNARMGWFRNFGPIEGVLLAPPCTHFAASGARWWPDKDDDGRTVQAVRIVEDCLNLVHILGPRWWMLENPVGRIPSLIPALGKARLFIHPHQYAHLADEPEADAYTKKTGLWGRFDAQLLEEQQGVVEPVMYTSADGTKRGSVYWAKMGGNSERVRAIRSRTPQGLARATRIATA